jgi:hypothetical protein
MFQTPWLQPLPTDKASFHNWIFAHSIKYGWNYERFHAYLLSKTMHLTGKNIITGIIDDIFTLLTENKIPYPQDNDVIVPKK